MSAPAPTADKKKLRDVRVHTPTVLQMEAVECGAASLAMILGYHGRYATLEQLRVECGVTRDGSKANNVLKAARRYGLKAKGYKKEPDGLRQMPLPLIAFWNFNHYLVVEGFDSDEVYLNDPISGPRSVSAAEFDESFTGVVLVFEKGPDFRKGGEKPSIWKSLAQRLPGSGPGLAFLIVATLALAIPGLVIPAFSRVFIDNILVGLQQQWMRPLLVAMAVTAIVRGLLTWLQQWSLLRLESKLALGASARFFWHILRLPSEFFAQRYSGDVSARVEINDRIAALLSGDLATNFAGVLMVGIYALLLFRYDATLALVGVALAAVNLIVLRIVSRKRKDATRLLMQDHGKLMGISMAGLQMIETYKATGAEDEFFSTWAGYHAKALNATQRVANSSVVLTLAPTLLTSLNAVIILWAGGLRVMDGLLTMGMLVAFQSLMGLFLEPVNKVVDLGGKLQDAEADMNRVDDILRYPVPPPASASPAASLAVSVECGEPKLSGTLELRNVSFGYSKLDPPLVQNLSLLLTPGQRLALVGGSGSGKSTVAKLVAGLYEPWEGEILFDGKPRQELSASVMARSFAMVDQDIVLFEGTIRDNLTLWDDTTDDPVIVRAAEDACIHDDITDRPGSYDYRLEEAGRNFSGGQRQRLEIARALVGNPRILVLDEATSALDAATEKLIVDAMRLRACTCLIVAHRLSTIRDCDEIVMLERGKVVERGTHDELIQQGGAYARLIQAA
jgi:NHLM bacteriocin system ABC transporter peptidase/ATP-binding protein